MQAVNIIQDSIDFIENNLKTDITLTELSNRAGYSKYHFSRIFKSLTGLSAMEYVNRRRLIYSAFEISNGSKVIDTALAYGYNTSAGFYKAFRKEFGCSPTDFISNHIACKPYKINLLQEEHIMINRKKLSEVLKNWNLHNAEISDYYHVNTSKRSENIWVIDNKYFLKVTTNLSALNKQINTSKALCNLKILTALPIKTINGDLYFSDGELFFILTEKINGKPLKSMDFYNSTALCYEVGAAIGKLHKAFLNQNIVCNENCVVTDAIKCIDNVKQLTFSQNAFFNDLKTQLKNLISKLPKQTVHRDLNPENILTDSNNYIFVDFDITEKNIHIFDICYCATAILSETFDNKNCENTKWFDILKGLINGYDDVMNLTLQEKKAIPYIICSIQIICISYFSKQEKYDDLTQTNIKILEFIIAKIFQL